MGPEAAARGLDLTMQRSLPAIFLGVGAFYTLLVLATPLLDGDAGPSRGLVLRWGATGAIGLIGAVVLRRRPAPAGWSNHLGGALGVVTVLNGLLLVAEAGPMFVFALIVSVVAFALFLLSLPWVIGLSAFALGGWLFMAAAAGGGPEWTPRGINLLAFITVAVVAQATRIGLHRRMEALKAREAERAAHEHRLMREAALRAQRRRMVAMTAHELRTPLTPVLLQAHRLNTAHMSADDRRGVEILQRNLKRLRETIDRVVAAVEADQDPSEPAPEGPLETDAKPVSPQRGRTNPDPAD